MNYLKIYQRFISDRRSKEASLKASKAYSESHHIEPISLGGHNKKDNLIRLTARDHYFAHCCLAKLHGGKMWSALNLMGTTQKVDAGARSFLKGRMFVVAREKACKVRSANMTQLWGSGEFTRDRSYGPMSTDTKEKIRQVHLGKKKSPASIEKRRATMRKVARTFDFSCIGTGEQFTGTPAEFVIHAGIGQSLTSCLTREKIGSAKGWILKGGNAAAILGRDGKLRSFVHKDGSRFTGTTYEFRTKYSLDSGVISNLINGKNRVKSFKGWSYAGEAEAEAEA